MQSIHIYKFLALYCLLAWTNTLVVAQHKKSLLDADPARWSHFYGGTLSADGRWVVYQAHLGQGADTLFVQHTQDLGKRLAFAGAGTPTFSDDGRLLVFTVKDKGVLLVQLKDGNTEEFTDATAFHFLQGQRFLALHRQKGAQQYLTIRDLATKLTVFDQPIASFKLNPTSDAVVYTQQDVSGDRLSCLHFGTSMTQLPIHAAKQATYSQFSWTRQGDALAFMLDAQRPMRYILPTAERQVGRLDSLADVKAIAGYHTKPYLPMLLSDDQKRIFFRLVADRIAPIDSLVEVWHARDSWIYPHRRGQKDWSHTPKLWVWLPETGTLRQLSDHTLPMSEIAGDQRHVLTYNPMWHAPQVKQIDDVDVYLTDAMTGDRSLLIEQLENGLDNSLLLSPGGKYIAYFKGGHWWSYAIATKRHTKLTEGIGVSLETALGSAKTDGSVYAYGKWGWTRGDQGFIVYDEFDCWLLSPTGEQPRRLTQGREKQIQFRGYNHRTGTFSLHPEDLDLATELVFEAKDSHKAKGYYHYTTKSGLQPLFFDGHLATEQLRKAKDQEAYVFTESRYGLPPRLKFWRKGMKSAQLIYQSNPHYEGYDWGHVELVSYKNSKNEPLQGALFYPAGYIPGKRYPMIVKIYQHLSGGYYEYENPSDATSAGFPVTSFVAQGYLVFCPDINYTVGDPGMSALDCVEHAVRAVTAKGIVDEQHIGLTGHSYGGYETAFIMTQSKLFATAIAGAPITDLVKGYLTINEEYMHTADTWRYETQQQRFGVSFYDNKEAYLRNSPIHQAKGISSPILIWTGQEDRNVHWQQSQELYFSLRRLDKPGALLVYPKEHHVLMDANHQRDLYQRMTEWFGYYLKGQPAADWIIHPQN